MGSVAGCGAKHRNTVPVRPVIDFLYCTISNNHNLGIGCEGGGGYWKQISNAYNPLCNPAFRQLLEEGRRARIHWEGQHQFNGVEGIFLSGIITAKPLLKLETLV